MSRAFVYPFGIAIFVTLILLVLFSGGESVTLASILFCILIGAILLAGMLIGVQIGIEVTSDIFEEEDEEF